MFLNKFNKLLLLSMLLAKSAVLSDVVEVEKLVDLKEKLKNSNVPSMVEVHAEAWCGPCKMMKEPVQKLATEYKGKLTVIKVDFDKCKECAKEYRVTSFPTFLFFAAHKTEPTQDLTVRGADQGKLKATIAKMIKGGGRMAEEKHEEEVKPCAPEKEEAKTEPAMKSAEITEITSLNQLLDLMKNCHVMLEFYKEICHYCVEMEEPFKELAAKYKNVCFARVHVNKNRDIVEYFNLDGGAPYFLAFRAGETKNPCHTLRGNDHGGLRNAVVELSTGKKTGMTSATRAMPKEPKKKSPAKKRKKVVVMETDEE